MRTGKRKIKERGKIFDEEIKVENKDEDEIQKEEEKKGYFL